MRVVWLEQAQADHDRMFDELLERDPQAAVRVYEAIRAPTERLADFPALGREGRVAGTRELVIARFPYIVPYYIKEQEVRIVAVLHAARKWPDDFSM
jgi:toxin ParE1/3/4